MKRVKSMNGYTIYQATEKDASKYGVTAGEFPVYFSSDIRDYGLSLSDCEYEACTLEEAEGFCAGSNYAIAKELVEAQTTAATWEQIAELEAKLDAGMSPDEAVEVRTCEECGCVLEDGEAREGADGGTYCDDCFNEEFLVCDNCGSAEWLDAAVVIEGSGEWVCTSCAFDTGLYTRCHDCGDWFRSEDIALADAQRGIYICDRCAPDWGVCYECGHVFRSEELFYYEGNGVDYCRECWLEVVPRSVIHPYSYKPNPQFFFTGEDNGYSRFYGVELEVDDGDDGTREDCARDVQDVTSTVYLKEDGSLNYGFEIVTHPCTLAYHQTRMAWDDIIEECRRYGFKSHDTTTCGLHVHVGRLALPALVPEKLFTIFTTCWDELLAFSRRDPSKIERWADKPLHMVEPDDGIEEVSEKLEKERYRDRYVALNLHPRDTIEIRIFRGTLRRETILACIQLVDAMVDFCARHTLDEVKAASWEDITHGTKHAELSAYLAKRGL